MNEEKDWMNACHGPGLLVDCPRDKSVKKKSIFRTEPGTAVQLPFGEGGGEHGPESAQGRGPDHWPPGWAGLTQQITMLRMVPASFVAPALRSSLCFGSYGISFVSDRLVCWFLHLFHFISFRRNHSQNN